MPTIDLNKKQHVRIYSSKRDNLNHKYVYNTKRWRQLRLSYLKQHVYCELCLKEDKLNFAIDVHHITPVSSVDSIEDKQRLGFDINNLMSLCVDCHKKIHHKNYD